MTTIEPVWSEILTSYGQKLMVNGRKWEIIAMYFQIGLYWNQQLSTLYARDTFKIPKTKHGIINGDNIYEALQNGDIVKIAKNQDISTLRYHRKDIEISPNGALFIYQSLFIYIDIKKNLLVSFYKCRMIVECMDISRKFNVDFKRKSRRNN